MTDDIHALVKDDAIVSPSPARVIVPGRQAELAELSMRNDAVLACRQFRHHPVTWAI